MLLHAVTASVLALAAALPAAYAAERGIAWPWFEKTSAGTFAPGAKWFYSWETYIPGGAANGLEFVPMQRTAQNIDQLANSPTVQNAKWILGFNEPDNPNADGSGLTPQQAASLWKQYIQPLRTANRKLVAPAVTINTAQGTGFSWLKEFIAACNGCTFDAYAMHPYSNNAASVQGSIEYFLQQGIKPLWVTEFNVDGANLQNGGSGFVQDMINYFNGKSEQDVARYSMIARVGQNNFVNNQDLQNVDGSLSAEGQTYKNA